MMGGDGALSSPISRKTNRILLALAERLERNAASDEELAAIERAATDKAFPSHERSSRHKAKRRSAVT
jgi:hypothetical protein